MCCDDAPAFREAHPGLHLASDLARRGFAPEHRRRHGAVTAISRDLRSIQRPHQADRRAAGAEGPDLGKAIEILCRAEADRRFRGQEEGVERLDVVGDERLLIGCLLYTSDAADE